MLLQYSIEGGNFNKAGNASSDVKKVLKQLNIDLKLIKRTVVSLYEAEVNVVAHANKGDIKVDINQERIHIQINDEGPGIPDINLAMQEGFSTASAQVREMGFGAGMGLPNIKRNSDKLSIQSVPKKGTLVEITNYINKNNEA